MLVATEVFRRLVRIYETEVTGRLISLKSEGFMACKTAHFVDGGNSMRLESVPARAFEGA
jgi:hypothetical protein